MHMALHRNGPRGNKGGGGERLGGTMPGACLFLGRDTQRDMQRETGGHKETDHETANKETDRRTRSVRFELTLGVNALQILFYITCTQKAYKDEKADRLANRQRPTVTKRRQTKRKRQRNERHPRRRRRTQRTDNDRQANRSRPRVTKSRRTQTER